MKMLRKFITIKEAAELIGVSPLTLRRWDNAGRFTPRRHPINRYRLYDRKELSKILTETHA